MSQEDRQADPNRSSDFRPDGESLIAAVTDLIGDKPTIAAVSALTGVIYAASTDEALDRQTRIRLSVMIYELGQNVIAANGFRQPDIDTFILEHHG